MCVCVGGGGNSLDREHLFHLSACFQCRGMVRELSYHVWDGEDDEDNDDEDEEKMDNVWN